MAWIIAVMSVAFYTMMSRYLGHVTRERRRSGGRYLRHGDAVVRTRDAVIFGLAKLAESRDPDTGDHLERISTYSKMLAKTAQSDPRFVDQITPVFVRNIGLSSALHDIGKVGIEDRVLLKRGPLSLDERVHMQSHVSIGGQCLRDIERRLGSSNFLQMAREIALCHHECWDGSGYPEGLCGKGIPLAARVVAIVDFYDALSTRRVYKEAFPHERCKQMIVEGSGTRFDPDLVEIWLTIEQRFAVVAQRFNKTMRASVPDSESTAQQAELQWEPVMTGAHP
jgi:response regulator RpfG family c-di-GMP phosphodiesterase